MDIPSEVIGGLIIWLFLSVIVILCLVFALCLLCRWIFRIDEIVGLLKKIAKPDKSDRRLSDLKRCAVCEKECPTYELIEIDSGQLVCSECHKMFVKKLKAGEL
jgi:NAD-dependent dihydropyrimidine dehydrogenase PreA subunit